MDRLQPQTPAVPWQEAPFTDTRIAGRSVWTWFATIYYLAWIWFATVIGSQPIPGATRTEIMIISFGVGLNWVAAAWFVEREGRVKR